MKFILSTVALAALVLGATAQSPMPEMSGMNMGGTMSKAAPVQVRLEPQNGSGETGTATLMDGTNGLIVRVRTSGGGTVAQPIHIHKGTCATLDPKPAYPLKTLTDGQSETTVPKVTIAQLEKSPYAINVHKSTSDIQTYVACGNIAKAQ
jgi:Cu/Zn superoxide dismutase